MLFVILTRAAAAQTAQQLGAWDALMLSPGGAVAPVARDPADAGKPGNALSLRYGRWQYDADDAIHDNIGLTWSRRFAFARSELSLTGAYLAVECPSCSGWALLGLSGRSTVLRFQRAIDPEKWIRASAALQVEAGGGQYRGTDRTSTLSVSGTIPVEIAVPLAWTRSLGIAAYSGIGYGSITGAALSEYGIVPLLGGAIGWTLNSRASVGFGAQRVVIKKSNTLIGATLSWKLGKTNGEPERAK